MNFTPAGKNLLLDSLSDTITMSLHTSNPTDAGNVGELSGGLYTRETVGYEAATNGNRNANALPTFDVPGGNTISHAALWYGATCIATGPLQASESFAQDGQYQLTDADLTLLNP